MEGINLDYPISFKGYDTDYVDEIIGEKDRVQCRDVESLKREIVDLKKKIDYLKRKKRR